MYSGLMVQERCTVKRRGRKTRNLEKVELSAVAGGATGDFPGQDRQEIERFLRELDERRIWEEIQRNHGR